MQQGSLSLRPRHEACRSTPRFGALVIHAALFSIFAATTSLATPYWIAWEGDDWPENQGWTHHAGNYFGGPLATRTLDEGWLIIDGTASHGISDFCDMDRPGALDPDSGEEFVMQWRLRVDQVLTSPYDPSVSVFSDDGWVVGIEFGIDRAIFQFESSALLPLEPAVAHGFELRSNDMRRYDLRVDGNLVRQGTFTRVLRYSHVGWGDAIVGAASSSRWDYVRFGVVPEPAAAAMVLFLSVATKVTGPRLRAK